MTREEIKETLLSFTEKIKLCTQSMEFETLNKTLTAIMLTEIASQLSDLNQTAKQMEWNMRTNGRKTQ